MRHFRHVGLAVNRLNPEACNPAEVVCAHAWQETNDVANTLAWLLNPNGDSNVTYRDRTVAATVIQWIGSPVGRSFLCESIINKSPELREYLKRTCHLQETAP